MTGATNAPAPPAPTLAPAPAVETVTPEVAKLPPVPIMPTRPSVPHMVFGNIMLAGSLYAYVTHVAPAWLVSAVLIAGLLFFSQYDQKRAATLRQRFTDQRLPEIRDFFADEAAAREQVTKDFAAAINLSPGLSVVSIPTFFLVLPFFYLVFVSVDDFLSTWFSLLRWAVAAFAAWLVGMSAGGVWAGANLTPALIEINYRDLRARQQEASGLATEDRNDIHIIRQVAGLDSLHRRVEAYTLEGALLSALSFSSFLAIILSDRKPDYLESLNKLFPPVLTWYPLPYEVRLSSFGRFTEFPWPAPAYLDQNTMGFICLSLLLCAATFLGVLVGRLHFNEGYRDAESFLRAAERLNEKEDQALSRDDAVRAAFYSKAIDEMLDKADELERAMTVTVMHMRLSRDAGILCFIVALTLCGLFFHIMVAGLIGTLFICAFLVGYADQVVRGILQKRVFDGGGLATLLGRLAKRQKPE